MFRSISVANLSYKASNIINSLATVLRKLFFSFQDTVLNEKLDTTFKRHDSFINRIWYEVCHLHSLYKKMLTNIVSPPTEMLGNQEDEQFLKALFN